MSKRSVTELQSTNDGEPVTKASSGAQRRVSGAADNVEMGDFEDAWEDEIESDEDIVDGDAPNDDSECKNSTLYQGLSI